VGEKDQAHAAERVIKEALNVRQTEGLVAKMSERATRIASARPETVAAPAGDPHLKTIEDRLREKFGTKVHLKYAQGKGAVEISFYSDAELQGVLEILNISAD
jgi:ParB family transcriptional regulator, chromosome partitioning protein